MRPILLDCTFRDGGYYNAWDFPEDIIQKYFQAMRAAKVDIVEVGFRFLKNNGFKGPCAYATDDWIREIDPPSDLTVSVMANGADLLTDLGLIPSLELLFPEPAADTPVSIVRIACHLREIEAILPATTWLSERGYRVGLNLMQISDRTEEEILWYAEQASAYPIEVLYFADSMGGMRPEEAAATVKLMRQKWDGPIGVHTHDNMGLALENTMRTYDVGATWLDATVTGMGRGPGNARTEELAIELDAIRGGGASFVPLMELINGYFGPMKAQHGWGSNPYYFLSGKYNIHPTYIQEMLGDPRYNEEDILAVIDHLRKGDAQKYSAERLHGARDFYHSPAAGSWSPKDTMEGRDVLLLGSGPGVRQYRKAIEAYVAKAKPVVLALNTQSGIAPELIDLRLASHPVRMLADWEELLTLPQPLVTPFSTLPSDLREALANKEVLDFGMEISPDGFAFDETSCNSPTFLVLAYALALANSGKANRILMAGFDGYMADDPRSAETDDILSAYKAAKGLPLLAITPTRHKIATASIYGRF